MEHDALPSSGQPATSEPQPKQVALEWERLRFERQKLALELRFKRRELSAVQARSWWKDLLANPLSIAIVGGLLTLITAIATNFLTAAANREAEETRARLARQSAGQTLQADLIKKFVESPRTETVRENLRFLVDADLIPDYAGSIRDYLAKNPGAAPQVGARLDFSPAGEVLSEAFKARLQDVIGRFRVFLQTKGFKNLDDRVSVFVYSENTQLPAAAPFKNTVQNAFYMEKTLFIHKDLSEDTSTALREYTHHALLTEVGPENFVQTEVESALADYLPATFLDSPVMGANLGSSFKSSGYHVRSVENANTYASVSQDPRLNWFERGLVWAGAIWACRQRASQNRARVDDLMVTAWRKANVAPVRREVVAERFGAALTEAPSPVGECFAEEIARRGLPRGTAR
jgi:hypothetical protein